MRKTSVYLTDEEAEGLRLAATATGRPQAELIRDGVRHVLRAAGIESRQFHSMGKGHGGGARVRWEPDDLYDSVMGRK